MAAGGRTILVVLIGSKETGQVDHYQLLQEQEAVAEASRSGVRAEVVFAPGFDHLRVIRKRLGDASATPVDALVVEPTNVPSTGLLMKEAQGKCGLVLMNTWSPEVEAYARAWGAERPFGTVSTDHERIGTIQGKQVNGLIPGGGQVLCITGPQRSSAAVDRLAGMKKALRPGIEVFEAEAGQWTEAGAIVAFDSWYSLYKTRAFKVEVIAAQSDDLAMGTRAAAKAVTDRAHRESLEKARLLGVDACPGFGRTLVDKGELAASVVTPATTGQAILALAEHWQTGRPLALRTLTVPQPYPPQSAA
jgi:ABC-type sugar transport system substrate-binding protein